MANGSMSWRDGTVVAFTHWQRGHTIEPTLARNHPASKAAAIPLAIWEIAVSRIGKLPFVYDASYSMEGETLIIDVDAMTRFFGDVDLSVGGFSRRATTIGTAGGGMRLFAGWAAWRKASASGDGFSRERNAVLLERPLASSASRRNVNVRWSYDTTDDAFFARQGEMISASPSWTSCDSQYETFLVVAPNGPNTILSGRTKGDVTSLNLDATKYWAVGTRDVIFSTLNGSAETSNLEFFRDGVGFSPGYDDANSVSLTVGAGRNFYDRDQPAGTRQRLEVGLRVARRSFENSSFDTAGVVAAWTLRRQFMNVKLSLSYDVD